ncbi:MAG: hypothetical protein II719_07620 [Clostridia bacterium]|nr:hypothetical protein [Clostridia bacterium]
MNEHLFPVYRALYEQVWLPIFVKDSLPTDLLTEACRLAGLKVVEYTLRRDDAAKAIPQWKQKNPDLFLLVGSTVDSDAVVGQLKRTNPQIMTLGELAPFTDGFVSMLPFSDETLARYSGTHLCIPGAETGGEALRQIRSGAAFIKTLGPDLSFSRRLHALPTFGYCPTYITGGVVPSGMKEIFEAGNVLCATGFDVILRDLDPSTLNVENLADRIRDYAQTAREERAKVFPALRDIERLPDGDFAALLPNYCSVL